MQAPPEPANWIAIATDFLPLITLLVGAIAGYFSAVFIEGKKDKIARRNQLREAYAEWFTNEALLKSKTDRMMLLVGNRGSTSSVENLKNNVEEAKDSLRNLVQTAAKISLLEKDNYRRQLINQVTDMVRKINDTLNLELFVQETHVRITNDQGEIRKSMHSMLLEASAMEAFIKNNKSEIDDLPYESRNEVTKILGEVEKTQAKLEKNLRRLEKNEDENVKEMFSRAKDLQEDTKKVFEIVEEVHRVSKKLRDSLHGKL